MFVVDSSGSIRDQNIRGQKDNWLQILEFMNSLIDRLDIGLNTARIGVVRYGNQATNIFYLNDPINNDKSQVKARVSGMRYMGENTNTSGGLRIMNGQQFIQSRGDRPNVPNIAIVITDGESTYDKERTVSDAVAARDNNIEIVVVGVTNRIKESELRLISSPPQRLGENYFKSASFVDLPLIVEEITRKTCSIVAPTPPPATPGPTPHPGTLLSP